MYATLETALHRVSIFNAGVLASLEEGICLIMLSWILSSSFPTHLFHPQFKWLAEYMFFGCISMKFCRWPPVLIHVKLWSQFSKQCQRCWIMFAVLPNLFNQSWLKNDGINPRLVMVLQWVISSGCLDLIVKDTFYRHKWASAGQKGNCYGIA